MEALYFELPLVWFILKALSYVLIWCLFALLLTSLASLGCYLSDKFRR